MPVDLRTLYDWREIVLLAHISRQMDNLEEEDLTPRGIIKYQFASGGHELGQLFLSQLLDKPMDALSLYYRSRPLMLGSGLTPAEQFVSGMARSGGISHGRDVGVVYNMPRRTGATVLPNAADVGSQYTPAVGWAQAIRYRVEELGQKEYADSIAVACGGEGSVAANGFWSALNIATTLKLPILFYIEDNGYAISVKSPLQTPGANIAANLGAFRDLQVWDGDGTDPAEAGALMHTAVSYVRTQQAPALLRLTMPRLSGHSSADNQSYKDDRERAADRARDPLTSLHDYLVTELQMLSQGEWADLVAKAERETAQALEEAFAQPEADEATVTRYVFSEPDAPQKVGGLLAEGIVLPKGTAVSQPQPGRLNMIEAIRRTLEHELTINERVLLFGEDVGHKGGVHAATLGLQTQFGEKRVFDTSLSEEGIIGRAVGMALNGLMPVPEIQFRKYADPATEQLNNCGTIRWRTANNFAAPLVVRMPGGYRKVGDPWHSVTNEVMFAHAVGWQVVVPSNAADAVGLLRTALRGNDPVIFFEHRAMYDAAWARRPYPGDDYMLPFGQAELVRHGRDLTIISWGAMVERCEQALDALGVEADLLDLRTLVPWDSTAVLNSVRQTGKALIVHEDITLGGFGAEIAAVIASEAFMALDGPVRRVAAPSTPIPFSQTLMNGVVPSVERIKEEMSALLRF